MSGILLFRIVGANQTRGIYRSRQGEYIGVDKGSIKGVDKGSIKE